MKPEIEQEHAEIAETEIETSAAPCSICSKTAMKPEIEQEHTEIAETEIETSAASGASCSICSTKGHL